jgi:hypothetical protein
MMDDAYVVVAVGYSSLVAYAFIEGEGFSVGF